MMFAFDAQYYATAHPSGSGLHLPLLQTSCLMIEQTIIPMLTEAEVS